MISPTNEVERKHNDAFIFNPGILTFHDSSFCLCICSLCTSSPVYDAFLFNPEILTFNAFAAGLYFLFLFITMTFVLHFIWSPVPTLQQ